MRFGRTLSPAAAPLRWEDLWHGLAGVVAPARALEELEAEIRQSFGVSDVFLVSSGKAALTLALMALKSQSKKTEVVIPAYTCFSVPAAVLAAGLRPRLCDVDPETFDFDHARLERSIGANTLCVITHHLFGIRSDVERTCRLCWPRGISVVEDAAQAMGIEHDGRMLGTTGDVGIFSLGRGKAITCGSGGIIVTRSRPLAGALAGHYRRLRRCPVAETLTDLVQLVVLALFIRPRLYWIPAALPWLRLGETIFPKNIELARLSGMKAGLLHRWRVRFAAAAVRRSEAAADFAGRLHLRLPSGPSYPYLRLPIRAATLADKQRLQRRAQARGLGVSSAYPTPVNEIPELRAAFEGEQYPAARLVADTLLTLPTHHWVSERDRRTIADLVATAIVRPVPHAAA